MEVRWYKNSNVSSSLSHEIQKQKNDDSRKNKRVDTTEKRTGSVAWKTMEII